MSKRVEDLFPELGKAKEVEKKKVGEDKKNEPVSRKTPPEAIVLCTMRVECGCGRSYETPNLILMARYGRNFEGIREWPEYFNLLPREEIIRTEKAPVCRGCFSGKSIGSKDFLKKNGKMSVIFAVKGLTDDL